jgi:hypothetical protein
VWARRVALVSTQSKRNLCELRLYSSQVGKCVSYIQQTRPAAQIQTQVESFKCASMSIDEGQEGSSSVRAAKALKLHKTGRPNIEVECCPELIGHETVGWPGASITDVDDQCQALQGFHEP